MRFSELPDGTKFFDIDGIAVAILPGNIHIAFSKGEEDSRSYPPLWQRAAGSDMGDELTREEFGEWLRTGRNKFDC